VAADLWNIVTLSIVQPGASGDTHPSTSEERLDIQELKEVIQNLLGQGKQLEL
jgi:hypothetical protein